MKAVFVKGFGDAGKSVDLFSKECKICKEGAPMLGLIDQTGRVGMVIETASWGDLMRAIILWKVDCEVEAVRNVAAVLTWAKHNKIRRVNGNLNGIRLK